MSCFRCHNRHKEGETVNCSSCHGTEHAATLDRKDERKDVLGTPSPGASLGWAAS